MSALKSHTSVHDKAVELHANGQSDAALDLLKDHLTHHKKDGLGYRVLGTIFTERGEFGRAIKALKAAIEHGIDTAETRTALASVYFHLGQEEAVDEHLEVALELEDGFPLARLLSVRRLVKTDPQAALGAALDLASDDPEMFDVYPLLSGLYRTQFGDLARAQACLDRAVGLDPGRLEILEEQAGLYLDYGMVNAARVAAEEVLSRSPQSKSGVLVTGLAHLSLGNFAEGWPYYARRREHAPQHAQIRFGDVPGWDGTDPSNLKVLVWTDQSVGDEILYASMLPDLIEQAGQITLVCSPRMVPVFQRSFPEIDVLADPFHEGGESPKLDADVQVCLPDLGQYFRPNQEAFPSRSAYLKSDPQQAAELRQRYLAEAPDNKLVGISWRSRQAGFGNAKSSDLRDWRTVLEQPGYTFVALQYGDIAEDLAVAKAEFAARIVRDPAINPLEDMDSAMAQVAAMDHVISTSNTTVHMAAAQGRPTTLALPQGRKTVWYWGISGETCAFYPSLRIVRSASMEGSAICEFEALFGVISQTLDGRGPANT